MAEPGQSEIVTTTGRWRSMELKDNVSDSHPLLVSMDKYDGMEEIDGGRSAFGEMTFAQNPTVGWYADGQEFDSSSVPVMTSAESTPRQLGGSVFITGKERRMNAGKEQFISLVSGKMQVLEDTMMNILHAGLLSDGTGSSGNQLVGALAMIAKIPTSGTLFGIDRSLTGGAFYRNYKFATASDWSNGATSPGNIKQLYDKVINATTRGMDKPTVASAGNTHWEYIMLALQAQQRFDSDPDLAAAGFENIVYRGVPIVFGGGMTFSGQTLVQDDLTYFFNTKYFKLLTYANANFEFLDEVQSINQDVIARLMIWMGMTLLTNAKAQGVLFDS